MQLDVVFMENWEIKTLPILSRAFWLLSRTDIIEKLFKEWRIRSLVNMLVRIQNAINENDEETAKILVDFYKDLVLSSNKDLI